MKALGDNVFIIRDPMEKEYLGLEISEGALTKSYIGTISSIESNGVVNIGDKVHIPHYGVTDHIIDGKEYAITKADKLFGVFCGEECKPINRRVKIRKCLNDHIRKDNGDVSLYITDSAIEQTNWVEIIDVSDDCQHISRDNIGWFCIAPESTESLSRIQYSKDYMLHEDAIEFLTDGE